MKTIPHFDFGGDGQSFHFLHANGYPPECYEPFFEILKTKYRLFGMKLRPLWDSSSPDEIDSWNLFTDDLLRFLSDGKQGPVIAAGHSIGGTVTLRAALREPSKFRAIILLDPVLFIPPYIALWNIVKTLGLGRRLHPKISGALKRRTHFDDLETLFNGYRSRSVFRYMNDESLRIFIQGITKPSPNGGGFDLKQSPEWEARIYYTGLQDFDIWRALPKLQVPTLVIRGAETDTFSQRAAALMKRKQAKIRIEALPKSTHILPLEHPNQVFEIIETFLKETL